MIARGATAEVELTGLGPAAFVRADAASPADAALAVLRAEERFGRLDILVASAGVGVVAPLSETTREDWQMIMDVNVGGCTPRSRPWTRCGVAGGAGLWC